MAGKAKRFNIDKGGIDEYKSANKKWHIESISFNTLERVHIFLDKILGKHNKRTNLNVHDINGIWINLRISGVVRAENLTIDDKMLKEKYDTLSLTQYMPERTPYLVVPVYADKDAKDCTFVVRYKVV